MSDSLHSCGSLGTKEDVVATFIVGPNPLLCESLACCLDGTAFEFQATVSTIDQLTSVHIPSDCSSLVVVDACDHPGDKSADIERFKREYPHTRLVVLANHCKPAEIAQVVQSGANGYLATITTCDNFVKSLELVMSGQTILPTEGLAKLIMSGRTTADDIEACPTNISLQIQAAANDEANGVERPDFSDRELQILTSLTEGNSNKVIARECDIAEGTVKVHVKAVLRKIKVKNRTQAAIWAVNNRAQVWPDKENQGINPTAERSIGSAKSANHRRQAGAQVHTLEVPEDIFGDHQKQIRCIAGIDVK